MGAAEEGDYLKISTRCVLEEWTGDQVEGEIILIFYKVYGVE